MSSWCTSAILLLLAVIATAPRSEACTLVYPSIPTVPAATSSVVPVKIRSLNGVMRGPGHLSGQPQPKLSLDLIEVGSGRLLQHVQTSDNGEFSFVDVSPGLYFLKLNSSDLIAVTVDRSATEDHLDLDIGWTDCGLWYTDRSKCPQPDLKIEQLSGQVLDAGGAAIADATILLLDHTQTVVERIQSDSSGEFKSSRSLAGTYELVVSAPGFTPLRRTVHAEFTGDSANRPPLKVQLGIGGSCSESLVP